MYSPSGHLTEIISSYLGDFFQSVEKDHLQVSHSFITVMAARPLILLYNDACGADLLMGC